MLSTELVFELFVLKAKIKDVLTGCIVVMVICFIKRVEYFKGTAQRRVRPCKRKLNVKL